MKRVLKNCYFSMHDRIKSECIFGEHEDQQVDLTIVIPTYKRKDLLRKTINSILNQKKTEKLTYHVIIVSNDPEYDASDLILVLPEKLFSIYRNEENIGMVGNINRCACLARGKYISYIQDDDVLLDNYLITIEKLLYSDKLTNIDCLIPNRYYFYDKKNVNGNFGRKAYMSEKVKHLLKSVLAIGTKKRLTQRVTLQDCADTWFNCFAGGPTCGMLFNRSSLISTEGFPENYPYAFDFVFFIDFSLNHNVVLYDEFLSVYRMTNSASNRAEVQVDFYRADLYLLEKTKKNNVFVNKYMNEILHFSWSNKSDEAKKLISQNIEVKRFRYLIFRLKRLVALMRKNVYRKDVMPDKYKYLL